jgi:predicted nucleic acid-binding protein
MGKQEKYIFVDADAFVALSKSDDSHFEQANQIVEVLVKNGARLVSNQIAVTEAATVLSMRVGHAEARAFLDHVQNPHAPTLLYPLTESIFISAQQIFKKQSSKNVSLFDCIHMATVQEYALDAIFSFDSVYKKNGFNVVEVRL